MRSIKAAVAAVALAAFITGTGAVTVYADGNPRAELTAINKELKAKTAEETAAKADSEAKTAEMASFGEEINSYTIHSEYLQETLDIVNAKLGIMETERPSAFRKLFLSITNGFTVLDQYKEYVALSSDLQSFKKINILDMSDEDAEKLVEGLQERKSAIENELIQIAEQKIVLQSGIDARMEELTALDSRLNELGVEIQLLSGEKTKKEAEVKKAESFIKPAAGRLSSPFGYRIHPVTGARSMHTGIDLANSSGTAILASRGGIVERVGYEGSYGKIVIINHGGGLTSLYAHLSSYSVKVGQKVERGQRIGSMGSTGRATGSHLHFEIRVNGTAVNPYKYIGN